MMISRLYKNLLDIALTEFETVVESGEIFNTQSKEPWKLRLYLWDASFIDIYCSTKGKYSYHWDRRVETNKIYRHDNAPHKKWKDVPTFPKHFHNGLHIKRVFNFCDKAYCCGLGKFIPKVGIIIQHPRFTGESLSEEGGGLAGREHSDGKLTYRLR